jgi:hypothetical protein
LIALALTVAVAFLQPAAPARGTTPKTASTTAAPQGARMIEKGDHSNIDDARQVLVRTDAEWSALWQQHAADRPKPTIDFSQEMVVGVFMGSRPNAGFSTTITLTTAANLALIVKYRETIPPRDAITAQVITAPYHLIAIPKAEVKDVKFEKVTAPSR